MKSKTPKNLQKKIVKAYRKKVESAGEVNKTQFCKKYGISPRTLGRWLDKFPISDLPKITILEEEDKQDFSGLKYTITNQSVALFLGKENKTVLATKGTVFSEIVDHLLTGEYEQAWLKADIKEFLKTLTVGAITVTGQKVTLSGVEMSDNMTKKLVNMLYNNANGQQIKAFAEFMQRLYKNGDKHIVQQLEPFLSHNECTFNEDGSFNAYKGVKSDYTDWYGGTIDNSVGQKVVMNREDVLNDPRITCGRGLHGTSSDYAKGYGDRVMRIKIFPEDVVSVPYDYNGRKLRCCAYEVVGEVDKNTLK